MSVTARRILYLARRSPYDGARAIEFLDAVLVGAVFEQPLSVLFVDDGVWQLLEVQNDDRREVKTVARQWSVLPEYDVQSIFVCESSLKTRGLAIDRLSLSAEPVSFATQASMIRAAAVVISD